jgi:delta endotoxin, N-terminal domain
MAATSGRAVIALTAAILIAGMIGASPRCAFAQRDEIGEWTEKPAFTAKEKAEREEAKRKASQPMPIPATAEGTAAIKECFARADAIAARVRITSSPRLEELAKNFKAQCDELKQMEPDNDIWQFSFWWGCSKGIPLPLPYNCDAAKQAAERVKPFQEKLKAEQTLAMTERDPCRTEVTPPETFTSKSNTTRAVMLGAIGAAPGAANLLSVTGAAGTLLKAAGPAAAIMGFFWKDEDNGQRVFDAMKAYVDKVVPEMIDHEHEKELQLAVEGLTDAMDEYTQLTSLRAKGNKLSEIVTNIQTMERQFFDFKRPEKRLPHFVAFGTLKLVALRELYLFGQTYFGPSQDPINVYLPKLRKSFDDYSRAVADMSERTVAWRMSKLRCDKHEDERRVYAGQGYSYPVYTPVVQPRDQFCQWDGPRVTGPEHRGDESAIWPSDQACPDRSAEVRYGFLSQLDVILEPTRHWEALAKVPDVPPPPGPGAVDDNPPQDTALGIVPCLKSKDPEARDVTTDAGMMCRRQNIDKFLAALDITASPDNEALQTCLKDLRDLLQDGRGRARATYYGKLESCTQEAQREHVKKFEVDSATDTDTPIGDGPSPQARDGCDAECASAYIRTFE